jgi:hypothetical protein
MTKLKKKEMEEMTCKYLEICDCGQEQLCEHPKSEDGICEKDYLCPATKKKRN